MRTQLIHEIAAVRAAVARERREGKVIGLVPTMGALHEGHASLIDAARRECGLVVVSVFVNPIQFNQPEDYARYPRTLETDLKFASKHGADYVFAPEISEMYPRPQRAYIDVEALTDHLCGEFRPGHFRGVATVVTKLFNIVQPDRAYFGEKDAQQLAVIRRMTLDLNLPVEIVPVPTVREASGLALSSRNQHLSDQERCIATALYESLRTAREAIGRGEIDAGRVKSEARTALARHPEIRVEYFEIVDPDELQPVATIGGSVLVAVAAWLGNTRLIDNVTATPPPDKP